MRLLLTFTFAVAAAVAITASAPATEMKTVRGEVVDLECSLTKGAAGKGEDHAACAMRCARDGGAMALLTDEAVYVIEGSYVDDKNAKLLDFVARKVEAKGSIRQHDGKAYINIAAMMVQK